MPFEPWLQTEKGRATESEQGMSHDDMRYAKGKKREQGKSLTGLRRQ